jgi:ferrochelatase
VKRVTAVVLFSLGGPDGPHAVRPFLFNLFNDPAIIDLPRLPRWILAHLISWRRAAKARAIYAKLGGGSPLLANTVAQGLALSRALDDPTGYKVFVAMRYWKPFTASTMRAVKAIDPARVILLPLYPQFSGTTSGSSYRAWMDEATRQGLDCPHRLICCYPDDPGFVQALAALAREGIVEARKLAPHANPLVLFSAHGLPKKVVARGDPYQSQIEQSAQSVASAMGLAGDDWSVCYQSRVGPLEWIGPATETAIDLAARNDRSIVLVPIAFVSEHSETLVELDIEYRELAEKLGAPAYVRVPTVSTHPRFIEGLADLVRGGLKSESGVGPGASAGSCQGQPGCPCRADGERSGESPKR